MTTQHTSGKETVRVQLQDGTWKPFDCEIRAKSPCEIYVPALNGLWAIGKEGMIGNIGGND